MHRLAVVVQEAALLRLQGQAAHVTSSSVWALAESAGLIHQPGVLGAWPQQQQLRLLS